MRRLADKSIPEEHDMQIRTFSDLVDWTRQLHEHLAVCLAHCATQNEEEQARALLDYLAEHEAKIEKMVRMFEDQAAPEVMKTYIYDYLTHQPIQSHRTCDAPYATLGFDDICREVLDYHQQVIGLYRDLEGRAEIPEAKELFHALLAMEEHEAMLLARQTGRMADL